jgi:undecaprenyl-diphosphatase
MVAPGAAMRRSRGLIVLAAVAASLFLGLAAAVEQDGVAGFDEALRAAMHRLASPLLTFLAEQVTWLGSLGVLALFGAIAVAVLVRAHRREEAVLLTVTMAGALVLENGLKYWFQRARPAAFFGPEPTTYSFPSGHALFSLCFYGMLAIVLARPAPSAAAKAALRIATGLLLLAIGATRIYLGMHYPSDVLAGYLVAIAWIAAVLAAERRLRSGDAPPLPPNM